MPNQQREPSVLSTKTASAPPRAHRQFEGRRNKSAISLFPTADALLTILRRYLSPSETDDGRLLGTDDKTKNSTLYRLFEFGS